MKKIEKLKAPPELCEENADYLKIVSPARTKVCPGKDNNAFEMGPISNDLLSVSDICLGHIWTPSRLEPI